MSRPPAVAWAPLLVLPLLAGCLDQGERFDPVAVPVWQPGFEWVYDSTVGFQGPGEGGEDSQSTIRRSAEVAFTVINTTQDFQGTPVYHVRTTPGDAIDHPFVEGDFVAMRQSDLEVVARGWIQNMIEAVPVAPGQPPVLTKGCEFPAVLEPTEFESFPRVRFPIRSGDEWAGELGDGPPIRYGAKVVGRSEVNTAAGAFDAIEVLVTFHPAMPEGDEEAQFLGGTSRTWYAPEVRNYVRNDVEVSFAFGGREGSYSASLALREFSLEPGPAQPAPLEAVPAPESLDLSIYALNEMPLDFANLPVTASFAVGPRSAPLGGLADGDPVELALPKGTEAYWQLYNIYTGDYILGQGLRPEFEIADPGSYNLQVQVRGKPCSYFGELGSAHASIPGRAVFDWTIPIEPGGEREIPVDAIDIGLGAQRAFVEWNFQRSSTSLGDTGEPLLRDPNGQEANVYGSEQGFEFAPFAAGRWDVSWRASGPHAGGQSPLPVVSGDDVDLLIRIEYGEDSRYPFH